MHPKVITNHKLLFLGSPGALGGVLAGVRGLWAASWGHLGTQDQKKWEKGASLSPPGPPSWRQNLPEIDMMGVPRASLLKKVELWGVFVRVLVLVLFFEGPNVDKIMIWGG